MCWTKIKHLELYMCILDIEEKESTKPGLARLKYSLRRQISQYIKAHLKANYNIQPSPSHCFVGDGLEDNATLKKTKQKQNMTWRPFNYSTCDGKFINLLKQRITLIN